MSSLRDRFTAAMMKLFFAESAACEISDVESKLFIVIMLPKVLSLLALACAAGIIAAAGVTAAR